MYISHTNRDLSKEEKDSLDMLIKGEGLNDKDRDIIWEIYNRQPNIFRQYNGHSKYFHLIFQLFIILNKHLNFEYPYQYTDYINKQIHTNTFIPQNIKTLYLEIDPFNYNDPLSDLPNK